MRTGENGFAASFVLVFLCQWFAIPSIHSLPPTDASVGHNFDFDSDLHQDGDIYPPHPSSSSREESPALDEINEPPVSEGEDEDEDSSSLPTSRVRSRNLFTMNQDNGIRETIDGSSDRRFWSMIDDPLVRSSSRKDARHLRPSTGDLFASAAARHQQQNGHQGFFQ